MFEKLKQVYLQFKTGMVVVIDGTRSESRSAGTIPSFRITGVVSGHRASTTAPTSYFKSKL